MATDPTVERDRLLFGTTFTYDGQPLDPVKVITYRTEVDGTATEVEEYDEWRLTGQPNGDYPPYDFTARSREHIESILHICRKANGRGWTDVQLTRRHVVITRTEWANVEPLGAEES